MPWTGRIVRTVIRRLLFTRSRRGYGRAGGFERNEVRNAERKVIAETQALILGMIDRLPPNQQEVVRLKFQNGFSYKEIARITTLSVVIACLRLFTPSSSEPSVTPVAAKMQSPLAMSSSA